MRWCAIAAGLLLVILIIVSYWALMAWLQSAQHDRFQAISNPVIATMISLNDHSRRPATAVVVHGFERS